MTQDKRAIAAAEKIQDLIGPNEDCEGEERAAIAALIAAEYAPLVAFVNEIADGEDDCDLIEDLLRDLVDERRKKADDLRAGR